MLMVGQGYALSGLKDLSGELDLDDCVLFLGSVADREYLRSLYCRADFLLFPSLYDTFSIVVREAASQGCPALLIENSNASEGITDGFNAFLSKDGADNIAERVIKILGTPDLLRTVGNNAYKTLYVSWENIVDQVYERYSEIVRVFRKLHA
jgi:glycosyltransferase involved in cell wall biosynthesis